MGLEANQSDFLRAALEIGIDVNGNLRPVEDKQLFSRLVRTGFFTWWNVHKNKLVKTIRDSQTQATS